MQPAVKSSSKKDNAITFLKLAASGKLDEAYDNYIAPNFRHHNAYFAGDAESLKAGMAEAHKQFPTRLSKCSTPGRMATWLPFTLESHTDQTNPTSRWSTCSDLNGDQVAELWDVGMEAPKDSPNKNGLF
jgi:hypothetical protein